ncbi:MAG: hypothetical protein ACK4M9_22220 [Anaerobacillus sp.]|uniref:hypothetical protein n=1 Tax=Anaerobacillus sp. TaxID=1872506 RepID=UPI003919D979
MFDFDFLVACTTDNSNLLDTSSLEEVENNISGREFKPVPKDVAITALPFEAKFPKYIPFPNEESAVTIGDWDRDFKKIVYSITYHSNEDERVIEFIVANFDRNFSIFKEDNTYEEITLDDGTVALFQETPLSSAQLHWLKDGIEYNLHYFFVFNEDHQAKEELHKIANSINND